MLVMILVIFAIIYWQIYHLLYHFLDFSSDSSASEGKRANGMLGCCQDLPRSAKICQAMPHVNGQPRKSFLADVRNVKTPTTSGYGTRSHQDT